MSVTSINIDGTAIVNIEGYWSGYNAPDVLFEAFEDDEETSPQSFTGIFSMNICTDAEMTRSVLLLTEGAGLIRSGNSLTIVGTYLSKLKPGSYFHHINDVVSSSYSLPIFHGTLKFKA